jgi:hypothetical protein
MSDVDVDTIAGQLLAAYRSGTTISPLTRTYPGLTVDEAYAIQQAMDAAEEPEPGPRDVALALGGGNREPRRPRSLPAVAAPARAPGDHRGQRFGPCRAVDLPSSSG